MVNSAQLGALFARIPLLAERDPESVDIAPLAGLTNLNYRLRAPGVDWVLRVPQAHTADSIDRQAEAHNQRAAAQLGLAPLWAWRDASGLSLTPTQPGRCLCRADFDDPGLLDRLGAALRRLHRSGLEFRGRVEPGPLIDRYFDRLPSQRQRQLEALMRQALDWRGEIAANDSPPVPSHNDLVLENLLIDGRGLCLIDWEFSAMASPCWDLATVANSAGLDSVAGRRLLDCYCAGGEAMKESTFIAYRKLLALLDDCWRGALLAT